VILPASHWLWSANLHVLNGSDTFHCESDACCQGVPAWIVSMAWWTRSVARHLDDRRSDIGPTSIALLCSLSSSTTCVAPTSRDVTGRDVWVAARKLLSCNCPASYERIIVHYICCSKADTNSSFPASKFLNARLAHRKLPQSFSGKQRQMRQQLRSFCPFTSDGQTDILIINV